MLRYATYRKGKATIGTGKEYAVPSAGGFIWLFVTKPGEDELQKLSADFHLNLKLLKSYARSTHSKRFSTKPFTFVFADYFLEKGVITQTKVLFIFETNYLIIITPNEFSYYQELFDTIAEELKKKDGKKDISYILFRFLEEDTEENYDVLEKTESRIIELEMHLVNEAIPERKIDVREILKMKRSLLNMSRRFWASAKIIFSIKKGLTPLKLRPEHISLFDDIYNTFQHQLDIATTQKEMLSDALEIYATSISNHLTAISNNLNKVMKTLTTFTVIIIVPSLIAGVYGMNFAHLPLADLKNGFWILTGGMGVVMLLLLWYFYRKEWV